MSKLPFSIQTRKKKLDGDLHCHAQGKKYKKKHYKRGLFDLCAIFQVS